MIQPRVALTESSEEALGASLNATCRFGSRERVRCKVACTFARSSPSELRRAFKVWRFCCAQPPESEIVVEACLDDLTRHPSHLRRGDPEGMVRLRRCPSAFDLGPCRPELQYQLLKPDLQSQYLDYHGPRSGGVSCSCWAWNFGAPLGGQAQEVLETWP